VETHRGFRLRRRFTIEGEPDAVETIANAYVAERRHREGLVGHTLERLREMKERLARLNTEGVEIIY
jgi:hypothetical protein